MNRKYLWISLLMLAVLMFGQAALAQDSVELLGIVEAVGAGTITVNGQVIDVAAAEIGIDLFAGQIAKVEGALMSDGSIVASEVGAVDDTSDPRPGEIELAGVIESIDGNLVTINGITIDFGLASVEGVLVVGASTEIHASVAADGTLVAREAEVSDTTFSSDTGAPLEITGTLDEVGDGYILVDGQRIDITGAEIQSPLVVGTLVEIELNTIDGQFVASEVQDEMDDSNDVFDAMGGPSEDVASLDISDEYSAEVTSSENSDDVEDSNSAAVSEDGDGNHDDGIESDWEASYTVHAGDTLFSIALRAGTTVAELARVNGIDNINNIAAGTQLLVPHTIAPLAFNNSASVSDDDGMKLDNSNDDHSGSNSRDDHHEDDHEDNHKDDHESDHDD